jgi:hypothetical protein
MPINGGFMSRYFVPLAVVLALGAPRIAAAADCDTLGLGTLVYAQVGDTQTNLMKRMGRALRENTAKPLTLVWRTSPSCVNIDQIFLQTPIPAATVMQYVPSVAEDATWTPASPTLTCTIPAGGKIPDIANSALFNSACPNGGTTPAHVRAVNGATQAYVLAVPEASTQTAITFEEAYFVFGFGSAGMVTPWVDEAQMFIRALTTSTLLAWAANISVPGPKWKGQQQMGSMGSSLVVSMLAASTSPQAAIGILGAEVYDGERTRLSALAYRAKGQYAAYYPDSTSTSRDKKNVRDGHYTVWSPTVWMDRITGTTPLNADARYVVDLITSDPAVTPAPNFDPLTFVAAVGLVPVCAMRVQRSFEGGPLSLYTPPASCTCEYESLVDTTICATCSLSQPCTTGVCRNGYCEAQ